MGIFSFIKSQFIEVIEWTDSSPDTIVYCFPVKGKEIKMGAQLTVRESQVAIFVNEGEIADIFTPGRYRLETQNLPLLTKLKSWKYGFNSPFKAEVYFINTRQFTDQKWGTSNPIMMRDAEFGMLRLRAYGIYSFRVKDPGVFLKEVFGTSSLFTTDGITGQLKRSIVSGVSDLLGETRVPAIDLAMYYDELSEQGKQKLQPRFEALGLELVSFFIENISLPEEVEKVLDKRTSMGVIGDLKQYARYQSAEAMRDAARNPGGGLAGAGVGLGAGAALGKMMTDSLSGSGSGSAERNEEQGGKDKKNPAEKCPHCGAEVPAGFKFCGECGGKIEKQKSLCSNCGSEIGKDVKYCPECGEKQIKEQVCKNCSYSMGPGLKFCPECGTRVD